MASIIAVDADRGSGKLTTKPLGLRTSWGARRAMKRSPETARGIRQGRLGQGRAASNLRRGNSGSEPSAQLRRSHERGSPKLPKQPRGRGTRAWPGRRRLGRCKLNLVFHCRVLRIIIISMERQGTTPLVAEFRLVIVNPSRGRAHERSPPRVCPIPGTRQRAVIGRDLASARPQLTLPRFLTPALETDLKPRGCDR